jgi:hypothetical protein
VAIVSISFFEKHKERIISEVLRVLRNRHINRLGFVKDWFKVFNMFSDFVVISVSQALGSVLLIQRNIPDTDLDILRRQVMQFTGLERKLHIRQTNVRTFTSVPSDTLRDRDCDLRLMSEQLACV